MQDVVPVKTETQQQPPSPPPGYEYASFSVRSLAFAIDQFILFGIVLLLIIPVTILVGLVTLAAWPFVFIVFNPAVMPVTTVIAWFYFTFQESSKHQATFGKRLCGLRVVDMQGRRISMGRATARFFGKFLSSAIMLIGFFMAAFTERHQALHDIIAETLIVKSSKK